MEIEAGERASSDDAKDFVDSLVEEWRAVEGMTPTAAPVVARIMRMSYYIERRVSRNLAQFGLTRGEFEVMAVITRDMDREITPKVLQGSILVTSGGLSNRIKSLEKKGLLRRRRQSRGDGREVIVEATDSGRELTLRAAASHMELEKDMVSGLSEEDRAALSGLLRKLILLQEEPLNEGGKK